MSLILQPHRRDGLVLAVACGLIGLPYGVLADSAGLTMAQAMGDGPSLVVDARLIGVAAGVLAVARRAPMVAVVMVAMAVTALLRVVV